MYSACIFCHAALGANEIIETFPVGRRLAFDPARGRLWAVCRQCGRWNLTPLEERWEAVEACERLFRATRVRASTDQIGLARLPEGLELVRIGTPLRPELAVWRYGDRLRRRRRRALLRAGIGTAAVGGVLIGGGVALAVALTAVPLLGVAMWVRREAEDVVGYLPAFEQASAPQMRRQSLSGLRLAWESDRRDWALEVPIDPQRAVTLRGQDAIRAAALALPTVNRFGSSDRLAREAVSLLEEQGHPDALFRSIASEWDGTAMGYRDLPGGRVEFVGDSHRGYLERLAPAQRLALEMAAHESAERLAMEGELKELERAWRQAEEIAAIADDLLLPQRVRALIERYRSA